MQKYLLCLFLWGCCFHGFTQSPPSLARLLAQIDSFYTEQTHIALLEFRSNQKGEWLKYLPTLGITYTANGQARPMLHFSSTLLYRGVKEKQRWFNKQTQIREHYQLLTQQAKVRLRKQYALYQSLLLEIQQKKEMLVINEELFLIQKNKYEQLQIAPSAFLMAKRNFLKEQHQLWLLEEKAKHFLQISDFLR